MPMEIEEFLPLHPFLPLSLAFLESGVVCGIMILYKITTGIRTGE
jgi:hypothetical protein